MFFGKPGVGCRVVRERLGFQGVKRLRVQSARVFPGVELLKRLFAAFLV